MLSRIGHGSIRGGTNDGCGELPGETDGYDSFRRLNSPA